MTDITHKTGFALDVNSKAPEGAAVGAAAGGVSVQSQLD